MGKPEDRIAELEDVVQKQRRAYKTAENTLHVRNQVLERALRDLKWWRRNLHADTLLAQPDEEDLDKILDSVNV